MGRTEQFSEVTFSKPQIEGKIVAAKITGINGARLVA